MVGEATTHATMQEQRAAAKKARQRDHGAWSTELTDLLRAASGGLLLGVPLLYTVELYWIGQHTSPRQAIGLIGASFAVLVALNRTGGFRRSADTTLKEAATDAVEGLGLAIVLVALILVVLGEVDLSTSLPVMLGKLANEVLPVSLGIGVANTVLAEQDNDGSEPPPGGAQDNGPKINPTLGDLSANLFGAGFVALSIAPTDEVRMIAASRSAPWLIGLVVLSLLSSYAIVFAAGFTGQSNRHRQSGLVQHPILETIASYAVALVGSALHSRCTSGSTDRGRSC